MTRCQVMWNNTIKPNEFSHISFRWMALIVFGQCSMMTKASDGRIYAPQRENALVRFPSGGPADY